MLFCLREATFLLTGAWQRQFLPAPTIHDAAEILESAVLDTFEDVYWKRSRHVTDELHGDNDPQMRQHALEDDFYAGTVHDGIRVIDHVYPCGLMRVDVAGDLRAGVPEWV